jgi:hypothetical protein
MKRLLSFLPLVFLFIFFVFPISSLSTTRGISVTSERGESLYLYKDYYAVVVGISDYDRWPKLPNAVNDAKEVASELEELGFDVKLILNPTSREMESALNYMVYKMGHEENRALLFYYAGHGETETLADKTKMGYIIPKDCPLLKKDPMGFASHAISMRDIESVSLRIRAKHVIMFFDSCFSGSLFALVRAVPADITEKSGLPVRQYITAGREDEQVPDRSMFKRCLLIGLEGDADLTGDGYITGSELGMYLSDKLVNYTRRRQHPQYGKINNPDLDRGDFIFVPLRMRHGEIAKEKDLKSDWARVTPEHRQSLPSQVQREQLAHIPKEVKESKIRRVELRSTPKPTWASDVEKMIRNYNFFVKHENEKGNFRNNFVNNGDGTITDSATGLMWEKGGSSSAVRYWSAKRYVSRLNKKKFLGYQDWRIPTTEELASLLERDRNKKGLHISSLFDSEQKVCWTSDTGPIVHPTVIVNNAIDFSDGSIDFTKFSESTTKSEHQCFIRAVRSIK